MEAFRTPCADTKFQGEPLHRGRLIHGGGWEKLAIFDGYCRLSRKRCEIGQWLLYGTLIGSHGLNVIIFDGIIFKVRGYLQVEYLADGSRVLKCTKHSCRSLGALPRTSKKFAVVAEFFFVKSAGRCFTPVIEIKPNTVSLH